MKVTSHEPGKPSRSLRGEQGGGVRAACALTSLHRTHVGRAPLPGASQLERTVASDVASSGCVETKRASLGLLWKHLRRKATDGKFNLLRGVGTLRDAVDHDDEGKSATNVSGLDTLMFCLSFFYFY